MTCVKNIIFDWFTEVKLKINKRILPNRDFNLFSNINKVDTKNTVYKYFC